MNVSIVIPVYNEADRLSACLEAVARQTLKPLEVIVVDNNSTDASTAIVRQFDFATILTEPRQGTVYARNTGFDQARGAIIARIDADTILPIDWVEKVESAHLAAGKPALFAATAPSNYRNFPGWFYRAMQYLTYFWSARLLLGHTTIIGSNMFMTRQLWLNVRKDVCARNDVHEDMDLALHIGKQNVPILFRNDLRASVVARQVHKRVFTYPVMQLKIKFVPH
jgi:glycosyltransferase involved in cell wall biosynthesis